MNRKFISFFFVAVLISSTLFNARPAYSITDPTPTTDGSTPTTPTLLSADPVSSSQINLTWTASTDAGYDSSQLTYNIYYCQDTTGCTPNLFKASVTGNTSSAVTGLLAGKYYAFYIGASDPSGSASAQSNIVQVYTPGAASDTKYPLASIYEPLQNASISGSAVPVLVNVSDDVGINKVELRGTTGNILIATDNTKPYSFSWDTTSISNGPYSIYVNALDNSGKSVTSGAVNVWIGNEDLVNPTVSMTAPANNSVFAAGSNVIFSSVANDDKGIYKIEYYAMVNTGGGGWGSVVGTAYTSPYNYSLSLDSRFPAGSTAEITAKAYDTAGKTTNSIPITFTVRQPFTYTVTPTVGANGTISPNTPQSVTELSTRTFTITPNAGFIPMVSGTCGGNLTNNTYVTDKVTSNCTVVVDFVVNSGIFESSLKNLSGTTYGRISWGSGYIGTSADGTAIKMQVRSGNTDNLNDGSWSAWTDNCDVTINSDVSDTGAQGDNQSCVQDSERYVQYRAVLSTLTGTNIPTLTNVKIEAESSYNLGWFISSMFNSNDPYNSIQRISWNSDVSDGKGAVKFQLRTAPKNGSGQPDWAAGSGWCGPLSCSPATQNSPVANGNSYSISTGQNTLEVLRDNNKDQYFQYAAILEPSSDGKKAPILQDVTVQYSYNVPPKVEMNIANFQDNQGAVTVPYTVTGTLDSFGKVAHGTTLDSTKGTLDSPIKTALFYQPNIDQNAANAIVLPDGGIDDGTVNANGTTFTLKNAGNSPIPSSGYMLIEGELIEFAANGNVVTIVERGASFDDPSGSTFYTKKASHVGNNIAVFFKANVALQTVNSFCSSTVGQITKDNPCTPVSDSSKAFNWDPRQDSTTNLNGKRIAGMVLKVVANDADAVGFNNLGGLITTTVQTLDLESPKISSVVVDFTRVTDEAIKNSKVFGTGVSIPVKVSFTEPVFTNGDLDLKFDVNNGSPSICRINIAGTALAEANCDLTVNIDDNSDNLSLISGTSIIGSIKDKYENSTANLEAPAKQTLDVKVDGKKPVVDSVDIVSSNNNIKKAKPGDSVTLTVNANEDLQVAPTVTIAGQEIVASGTGKTYTAEKTFTATNNNDVEGDVQFTVSIKDKAGNINDPIANQNNTVINDGNVTFDRTKPTVSTISIFSSNADNKKAKVGDEITLTFTSSEAIKKPIVKIARDTNDVLRAIEEAKISNAINPNIYIAKYTMQDGDKEESIRYSIEFQDEAGNVGDVVSSTSDVVFDKTAPKLTESVVVPTITNDSSPDYTFTSDEAGRAQFSGGCMGALINDIAGNDVASGNNKVTFSELSEGIYACAIKVTDATGNESLALSVKQFEIDTTGKGINIVSPVSNAHTNSVEIKFVLEEAIQSGTITLRDQNDVPVTTAIANDKLTAATEHTQTITGLTEGTYKISIAAKDLAGNSMQSSEVTGVVYDTTPATLSLSVLDYFNSYKENSDISYSISNNNEILKDATIRFISLDEQIAASQTCALKREQDLTHGDHNNINLSEACENQITLVSDAVYKIEIAATDLAGNWGSEIVENKKFDITAPVIAEITSTSDNSTQGVTDSIYSAGEGRNQINITVKLSEKAVAYSEMVVEIQNGDHTQVEVTNGPSASDLLTGTYIVLASAQRLHDTGDLNIAKVVSYSVSDLAENNQTSGDIPANKNLADLKDIIVDTGGPVLDTYRADKGYFKATETNNEIKVTLVYGEKLKTGSTVDVRINANDSEPLVHLTQINNREISGIYEVQAGDSTLHLNQDSSIADNYLSLVKIESENVQDDLGNPAYTENFGIKGLNETHIDTENPYNQSLTINENKAETKDRTVGLALAVDDNMATDNDIQIQLTNNYSNDGNDSNDEWCNALGEVGQKSAFAQTIPWDMLNGNCGGVDPDPINEKENRTVYVKYIDQAGNEIIAEDSVTFDGIAPRIKSITSTTADGTYGPGSEIALKVTFTENVIAGSSVKLFFDNTAYVTLTKAEGEPSDFIEGKYIVGESGQDSNDLKVLKVDHNVTDTAGNVQSEINVTPSGTNLDANSNLIIDTTAPATYSWSMDRSKTEGKIEVSFKPSDPIVKDQQGMKYQLRVLSKDAQCLFDSNDQSFTSISDPAIKTVVQIDDIVDSIAKVCVQFMDKVGNKGSQSIISPETPENFEYSDISNTNIGFLGSFLTWKPAVQIGGTSNFRNYEVMECSTADKSDCDPTANDKLYSISNLDEHWLTTNNLSSSRKYCYRIRFKDGNDNYSKTSQRICAVPGESSSGSNTQVVVDGEDVIIGNISMSGAIVAFKSKSATNNMPVPTIAKVEVYEKFGDDPETDAKENVLFEKVNTFTDSETEYNVNHTIILKDLLPNQDYFLKIIAHDSGQNSQTISYNEGAYKKLFFHTFGKLTKIYDVPIAPNIVSDDKVIIDFKTDQNAKCFIDYKYSSLSAYGNLFTVPESEFLTSHAVPITDLDAKTAYDYKITCKDNDDNSIATIVTSDGHHFMTLDRQMTEEDFKGRLDGSAPVISNVALTNVTGENATITWETNEPANSFLAYELEGTDFMLMSGNYAVNSDIKKYSTVHSVQLKGLLPASKYSFTALSYDLSGNIGQSTLSAFTTKEPSSLSSIKVISKALGQANITWETGNPTSSTVEYGLTSAYGSKKEDSSKTKEHAVTLTDLKPGETYHFRVKGEDDQKNIYASSDITFQPKAPPKISDFKIDSITEHEATVTYTTNVPTDSLVIYADVKNKENSGFQGKPEVATKHETKLKNLASGTEFSIKLKVRDEDGNETEETFPNFTTAKDEAAPKIDRVKTEAALTQNDKVQAIISWSTDELATGEIIYKEGRNGDERKYEVNSAPALSHVGVITSFKSGVVYYFKVKSADAAGNTIISTDYALLTPKQRQNIIQVIIGNFTDIFGWAKF